MLKNTIIPILLFSLLVGCRATKPLISSINASEITEIGQLHSVSMVKVITNSNQTDNREDMNEMIKNNSEICFSEITNIAGIKSELIELSPIQENIVYKDIFRQIDTLLLYRSQKRKSIYPASGKFGFEENRLLFSSLQLSDSTINILKTQKKRFFSFTLVLGSTRTLENAKSIRKKNIGVNAAGIGLAILTGYGFYSFQNLYFCENHFLIIDADNNKLIFYNQTQTENGDPAKPNELRQNMLNGFDGYWIKKNLDTGKYSKKY